MRPLLALLLLAACASPDRAFWGAEEGRVTLDGRDYAVYVDRDRARPRVQVIRLGYARRGQHQAILAAMPRAAEAVSGCALVAGSAQGDSGVMNARLDCGG
ncbi:hypothetical protein [Pararhodobacter aggregans]|uniref:Lipoprotein n=1 Tax=Pararhodobacter aggregans TaxID=404875 RepID=A0A2T7UQ08_9RHOB|nr:hypothetical protein [Pararhodobacter aggregans]PTX01445.1 hypothetical protein C8N33_1079 [Pararhodobacter aggregans]PVE46719.1 hypothetical protein DDE23_13590 [Pararhodobacter aggregans]